MDTNLRPSGIEGLGDMSWGTHFCLFYETKEDLLDFFIPFFRAGLEYHEFCLCVASQPLIAEEAERAMRQALPDFERYLAEGQIEITPHTDWYLKEGRFDEQRVLQGWIDKLNQALQKGFSGVRFAANILLEKRDWESFAKYEGKLEETMRNLRIEGLCAYNLNLYSAANVLDIMYHHQSALARREGIWEPLEGMQLKRAHEELVKLNNELEQRVEERTAELAAANEKLKSEIIEREQSQARLQAAIDAADIGLWDWDLVSGKIIWLGHHENLFGLGPSEFDSTYAGFEKRVHLEDVEELNRVVQRAREEQSEYTHEYRIIWPDGSIHWIAGRGRFMYNEAGQPVRMYGVVLDITERKQVEEAIRKSEQVLREAESLGHTGSWEQNLVTGEIFNTEENLRLFFGDDHSKGADFEDYAETVHPDDREYVMQRRVQLLTERGPSDIEYRVVWPDGSVHVIFGRATVVYDASGQAIRVYGTNVDITERKQAEAAIGSLLQISEKLHATLDIDALLDSLVIEAMKLIDAEIGWSGLRTEEGMVCHTHIGRDLQVIPFKYTWPPGIGLPGWVLVHKVPYVMNDAQSDKFLIPEIREQFGVKGAIDTPILDAQGEVIGFFEVNNKKNGAGFSESDVEKLVAVSRIAAIALQNAMSYRNLQQAEDALRRSEDHLRLVIDTIPIMAWTVRPDGTVDYLNQRWMDYSGLSLEQYVAEPTRPIHPEDIPRVLEKWQADMATGEPYEVEMRLQRADGEYRWFLVRTDPLRDESGKIAKWYGVSTDIDDRKRAEEEMNRQAARAETLARIAARLNKQLDLDAVIHAVCEEAINTFKVSQVTMSLYDKKSDLLIYAGGINIPLEYAATMEPITRSQFDEFMRAMGPIMVVPDIQSLPDVPNAEFSSRLDVRTVVTTAMLRDQELVGALVVGVNGHVREFDQDELTLLKAISDQAAQAIANALLLKAANEQHDQLRALSAKLVEAQETERQALTTELHDRVGQNLTGLSINLQNMKALLSNETAKTLATKFDDAQALVEYITRQIRDIMAELHPPELEDYGLAVALETYAERAASRGNLKLIADLPDLAPPPLPSDVRIALFRAAQEVITNVLKHADSTQLEVSLEESDGRIRLRVEDDGQGFEPEMVSQKEAQTWGLKIMRERIESIGGKVQIESEPEEGTRVTFEIERPT